jgi:NTE family protein
MVVRIIAASMFLFFISFPVSPCYPEQTVIRFTLDYQTIHGGLKVPAVSVADGTPRLGLALAGGGAKAAAAVGVLKVLEQEGIPVAAVAGTSMGAAVGGLFAAGYRGAEIERIFLANDWNDIFNDKPARSFLTQEQKEAGSKHLLEFTFREGRFIPPYGLTAGQKLTNLLVARTLAASFEADLDFNRLKVPFRAIATDIETGEAVVLDSGLLHDAVRASTAIPLVFQPVEVRGRLLVDGGLVNNLPVDVARSLASDVVIAVDASAKLEKKERLVSIVEIMSQSISLQVRRESERQAARADLLILPDTSEFSFTDFPAMKSIINRGEDAARAALPRIRELMKPKKPIAGDGERYHITSLSVRGNNAVSDVTLRLALAPVLSPREATGPEIRKTLAGVYRLGHFSDVSLSLQKEGAGHLALLTVKENPLITAITVTGNTVIPKASFLSALDWQLGKPLNATRAAAELDKIVETYRNAGYLLARVERTQIKEDGTLELVLYEGRVDSIMLTGHTKTSRYLIRRETLTRAGKPLNFEDAAYDIQHLYALDYFESLSVDAARSGQGGLDLTLKIKEKPANRIRLGLRYDLEDHFTGLTDLMVDNVGGRGVKVFLNTRYGNYTDATFGYRSPVVLRTNFLHTIDAFYRDRNYFIYENKHKVQELDITRKGAEVAFGYQWFRFGDTYLRYRFVSDTATELLGAAPPEEEARIGTWAFLSTVDTRDSSTFPHQGTLFKFSYETADPAYGGNAEYRKTSLHAQAFVPAGERHTVMLEAAGGAGSGNIPYEEKYGIGGADYLISMPLLGYQRREFTGDNLLSFSAAYRFRILDYQLSLLKAVYLNLAYQAGNVWNTRDQMSFHDLRTGAGIGLHADTIVGPAKLDFARGEERRYALYFSAGFDF